MNAPLTKSPQFRITEHAAKRSQQRGISQHLRDALLFYGDREQAAGGGCYRLSFSRRRLASLAKSGVLSRQQAEKCARLTLITDGAAVVTAYRAAH